ncbi:MAG: redoxin domain-containing protein, partial [Bacteroidota bacterium]
MPEAKIDLAILSEMVTNRGMSLKELSEVQPILLVFLRHFGCTFCREALADISKERDNIEKMGTKIVFVHMTNAALAERYFTRYEIENATHICDPEQNFYKA